MNNRYNDTRWNQKSISTATRCTIPPPRRCTPPPLWGKREKIQMSGRPPLLCCNAPAGFRGRLHVRRLETRACLVASRWQTHRHRFGGTGLPPRIGSNNKIRAVAEVARDPHAAIFGGELWDLGYPVGWLAFNVPPFNEASLNHQQQGRMHHRQPTGTGHDSLYSLSTMAHTSRLIQQISVALVEYGRSNAWR